MAKPCAGCRVIASVLVNESKLNVSEFVGGRLQVCVLIVRRGGEECRRSRGRGRGGGEELAPTDEGAAAGAEVKDLAPAGDSASGRR